MTIANKSSVKGKQSKRVRLRATAARHPARRPVPRQPRLQAVPGRASVPLPAAEFTSYRLDHSYQNEE